MPVKNDAIKRSGRRIYFLVERGARLLEEQIVLCRSFQSRGSRVTTSTDNKSFSGRGPSISVSFQSLQSLVTQIHKHSIVI
jgi:hypothetical protein